MIHDLYAHIKEENAYPFSELYDKGSDLFISCHLHLVSVYTTHYGIESVYYTDIYII